MFENSKVGEAIRIMSLYTKNGRMMDDYSIIIFIPGDASADGSWRIRTCQATRTEHAKVIEYFLI